MRKLITILFMFVSALSMGQNRIYVSTSGSNSNSGADSTHAVQTLAYAESIASAGDTVCLKRGETFNITSQLQVTTSGTSGSPIVWDGYMWGTGDTAEIFNATTEWYPLWVHQCRYRVFQNFVYNGNNVGDSYGIVIGGNTDQNNEHDITIQNCEIKNIGADDDYAIGILLKPCANDIYNITIDNNRIHHISAHAVALYPCRTDQVGHPSYGQDSLITISNNRIWDYRRYTGNSGAGILVNNEADSVIIEYNYVENTNTNALNNIAIGHNESASGPYYPTNTIIRYNELINPYTTWIACTMQFGQGGALTAKVYSNIFNCGGTEGAVIEIQSGQDWTGAYIEMYNNTMYFNGAVDGLSNASNASNSIVFRNNILYDGGSTYCVYNSNSGTSIHSNNLYYRSSGTLISDNGTSYNASNISSYESTAETSDPVFVSNFDDMHLQATSPAIGAGTDVGVSTDYDGYSYASPPSMGAYEYVQGLPTVTTSAITPSYTTASGGGNVTSDGGYAVTARGVCWSTSSNPTISDSHTTDGTGTGSFTSTYSSLSEGTTYHGRAYATNSQGTAYGSDVQFTTLTHGSSSSGGHRAKLGGKWVKHNGKWIKL